MIPYTEKMFHIVHHCTESLLSVINTDLGIDPNSIPYPGVTLHMQTVPEQCKGSNSFYSQNQYLFKNKSLPIDGTVKIGLESPL